MPLEGGRYGQWRRCGGEVDSEKAWDVDRSMAIFVTCVLVIIIIILYKLIVYSNNMDN